MCLEFQTNVDDCSPEPCQNGGTCMDRVDDFGCVCPTGFYTKTCATGTDECNPLPCKHGGTVDRNSNLGCAMC